MTTSQLLQIIRKRLPTHDAEAIIQQALNITRTQLYTDLSIQVNDDDMRRIESVVERHIGGEPLAYIFGKAYFYDREFFVDENVLIPRPDTEILIETILNSYDDGGICSDNPHYNSSISFGNPHEIGGICFLDIGTGSGIIPIVLTTHRPSWSAVAVDVSPTALRSAAKNTQTLPSVTQAIQSRRDLGERFQVKGDGVTEHPIGLHYPKKILNNILLLCCDMFSSIKPNRQFDFIVSNPPYISSSQMRELDKSVKDHEPHLALHGGEDGLNFYRMISSCAKNYLKDNGRIYLEIGYDQGEAVPKIFLDDGWGDVEVIKDLGGRDRVVKAKIKN